MPEAVGHFAAVAGANGKIYAIGGRDTALHSYTDAVQVYDPSLNTWTLAAPLPAARGDLAAATGSDGTIYAIGAG
jgi:Kelch motif.